VAGTSTVDIAASAAAVRLGPELAFQQHEAPDPDAIRTDVGLDVGGRLADCGQVDAEQLRAPLKRRRDRPAQVRVVPAPTEAGYRTCVRERNQEWYLVPHQATFALSTISRSR
jgi:hypothetical protein